MVRDALLGHGLVSELFQHNLCAASRPIQHHATRLLCLLSYGSEPATTELCELLRERIELGLAHHRQLPPGALLHAEVLLLCELASIQDAYYPVRLQLLMHVFMCSLEHLSSAFVCERLVLPCLRLITRLCSPEGAALDGGASSRHGGSRHGGTPNAAPMPTPVTPLPIAADADASMEEFLGVGVCNGRLSATAPPGRSSHLLPPQVLHSARLEISGNASFILDFAILGSLCISVRSRTYAVVLKTVSDGRNEGLAAGLAPLRLFRQWDRPSNH